MSWLLWKPLYLPPWWLVALSRWWEVHPANSAFTPEYPDSLQHCINPVYHRNVGVFNLIGTVIWRKESSRKMRFPAVRVSAKASSTIRLQEEMPYRSLRKLTSLNFATLALLSRSAQWLAAANDTFYYTQVAFLDVCDTRWLSYFHVVRHMLLYLRRKKPST